MQCRFVGNLQPVARLSHHFFLAGQMIKFSGLKKMQIQQLFKCERNSRIFHGLWLGVGSVLSTGVFSDEISLAALFYIYFPIFQTLFRGYPALAVPANI